MIKKYMFANLDLKEGMKGCTMCEEMTAKHYAHMYEEGTPNIWVCDKCLPAAQIYLDELNEAFNKILEAKNKGS